MKHALKLWGMSLLIDGIAAACFYAWIRQGNTGAANIVVSFGWVVAALMLLIGFTCTKEQFQKNPRPFGYTAYHWITTILTFIGFAYMGHTVLAVVTLFATLIYEAARQREPKKGAQ